MYTPLVRWSTEKENITIHAMTRFKPDVRRIATESLGWLLVLAGLAAIVLPGPGLLMLFAGMALLATQYDWAERRLDPIRTAALKTTADSVKTWPRIALSLFGAALIVTAGIVWGLQPPVPNWWPIADKWWLVGGWGTGGTLVASGFIALAMIAYSFTKFRHKA
jgi:hypothetical protein